MVKKFLSVFKRGRVGFNIIKTLCKVVTVFGALMLLCSTGFAAPTKDGATLSTVSSGLQKSIYTIATILIDISVIAGIGFIFASFFKFHAWKNNPTQVPVSQGISLLLIGGALTMFPQIITIPGTSLMGSKAGVSHLGTRLKIIDAGTGGGDG